MQLYNDYNSYLKRKFGCRVFKIGIDAGFSCPNRDGSKGKDGCIYCNAAGSRSSYADPKVSVSDQLARRMDLLKAKSGAKRFIAYFQAFTNTYAPVRHLKNLYDQILPFEEIVGLSIGTRPDSVDAEKLKLISAYLKWCDVWLELGLQSSHDRTLEAINRAHSYSDFVRAVKLAKDQHLPVCAHIILGLPGESREDMLATADRLSELGVNGVKIHLFHILKSSPVESHYREGKVKLLEQEEYAALVCDFLERLSEEIIIQRVTGEGTIESHIAPMWALDKLRTIEIIKEEMRRRSSRQGAKCLCHLK